jgi:hypothetical protein
MLNVDFTGGITMADTDDLKAQAEGGIGRREALSLMLALGGMAGLTQEAKAGAHYAPAAVDIPSSAPDGVYQAIDEVLKTTRSIWNSQEFWRLKEVWDTNDPEPWYVPEEIEQPFFSWPQLDKYWNPGRKVLKGFRWDYDNLRVKVLADDLAIALFDHYYEIQLVFGPPEPTAGFDRVLTLFRKTPDGWKHILYAQCPLGPESYVRALRKTIVRDDFAEFRDGLGTDANTGEEK